MGSVDTDRQPTIDLASASTFNRGTRGSSTRGCAGTRPCTGTPKRPGPGSGR